MRTKYIESAVSWVLLIMLVLWSMVPIYFVVSSAFKNPKEIFNYPPKLIFTPTLDNFATLYNDWPKFFYALQNSVIITFTSTAIIIAVSTLAAYAFSRFRFKVINFTAFVLIAVRMFPPIVITVPLYPIFSQLHLLDTHVTLILLYVSFYVSLSTWVMMSFIDEIPIDLEEAAMVDGATRLQAFIKVTLPLITPGMVSIAILATVFCWNEFTFAYIFSVTRAVTAPITLSEMLGGLYGAEWGSLFTASTIQLVPMLIFVWAVQKYLIKGLTMGAIKG
ncbi:MAG: carbohydrate ABC transporter permease [Nitrososphaeria archaeon]|nr:carbohydrate ABC transporter permease [Nitrososphaeria archaeon]